MSVETERRVMLAHGIAFVLNRWGLVKTELVKLDLERWRDSSGSLLGNLKSVLADEAQWRSCFNAITAANWPSQTTLENLLDLAARKKEVLRCRKRCVC